MLTAKEKVTIRYNSKEFILEAGDKFDVRDFDVRNTDVVNVEKHIMKKNPGKMDISSNKADTKEYQEYKKEIASLNKTNEGLLLQVSELKDANEELAQKHAAMAGEVETAKQAAKVSKAEADRLTKINKDLEDEVDRLRARVLVPGKKDK